MFVNCIGIKLKETTMFKVWVYDIIVNYFR